MRTSTLMLLAATGLSLLSAAPALAQTVDELTVTGRALRERPQSLSETVSYADLDLRYDRDRARLERRVNSTARRICDRLNEPPPSAAILGHSCQEVAVRDAMDQVRTVYAYAGSTPAYAETYGATVSATEPTEPTDDRAYAPTASSYAEPASATFSSSTVTNGPVPDTPQNRARFGAPMSNAGKRTAARGN